MRKTESNAVTRDSSLYGSLSVTSTPHEFTIYGTKDDIDLLIMDKDLDLEDLFCFIGYLARRWH